MQVDALPGSIFGFRPKNSSNDDIAKDNTDVQVTNEGVYGHVELEEDVDIYATDKGEYLDFSFMFYNY